MRIPTSAHWRRIFSDSSTSSSSGRQFPEAEAIACASRAADEVCNNDDILDCDGYVERKRHRLAKRQELHDSRRSSKDMGYGEEMSQEVELGVDQRDVPFISCDDLTAYL